MSYLRTELERLRAENKALWNGGVMFEEIKRLRAENERLRQLLARGPQPPGDEDEKAGNDQHS